MTEKKNLFGKLLERENFYKASSIVEDLEKKFPPRPPFYSTSPCLSWMSAVGYQPGTMELLYGPKSSGKTMIVLDRIKNALSHDEDSIAIFVDAEISFDFESTLRWMRSNGVDLDRVMVIRNVFINEIFEEELMRVVKLAMVNEGVKVAYIAIDSIQALSVQKLPETEKQINSAELTKSDYGKRANYLAKIFPFFRMFCRDNKIFVTFIGQARSGGNDSYGNPIWATNGGEALYHEVQYRFLITPAGEPIFDEEQRDIAGKEVKIGHRIKIVCEKNKVGEGMGRVGYSSIVYMKGFVDIEEELIMLCTKLGIIESGGAWITYGEHKYNGSKKFAAKLKEDKLLYREIFNKMMFRATTEVL